MAPSWKELPLRLISTPTVFPVGPANVYLYMGESLTLFDAGTNTNEALDALCEGLAGAGVRLCDISQVILTHHHLDHVGLLRHIKNASGAVIRAHSDVPSKLASLRNAHALREDLHILLAELGAPSAAVDSIVKQRLLHHWLIDDVEIDDFFDDGDRIGPFQAHFRPGHSTTDTVFTHVEEGWAITGDHLIHRITPNPLLRLNSQDRKREKNLVQYYKSLLKTRELTITWCFAGHGIPFDNHRHAIDATIQHIERRGERTMNLLPAQGATVYEITQKLFPHLKEATLYYCLSATVGYLDILELQGKVCLEMRNGAALYRPTSLLA